MLRVQADEGPFGWPQGRRPIQGIGRQVESYFAGDQYAQRDIHLHVRGASQAEIKTPSPSLATA